MLDPVREVNEIVTGANAIQRDRYWIVRDYIEIVRDVPERTIERLKIQRALLKILSETYAGIRYICVSTRYAMCVTRWQLSVDR